MGANSSRAPGAAQQQQQQPPQAGGARAGVQSHISPDAPGHSQQQQQQQQQQQAAAAAGGGRRHRSRSLDFLAAQDSDSDEDGPAHAAAGRADRPHLFLRNLVVPPSFYRADIRCPVCSKTVPYDDMELHLVQCLTRPRVTYNEDVLAEDKDRECAICLEDLCQGDTIARLPCLCIYHKACIDEWFKRSRSCPEHPADD